MEHKFVYSFCKEYNKKEGKENLMELVGFLFTIGLFTTFIGSFMMILSLLIFAFNNGN